MKNGSSSSSGTIAEITYYISRGTDAELPATVVQKAKHHILDTLAAIVSGSALKPGQLAKKYVKSQRGTNEAHVVGVSLMTSAINAAFCPQTKLCVRVLLRSRQKVVSV